MVGLSVLRMPLGFVGGIAQTLTFFEVKYYC